MSKKTPYDPSAFLRTMHKGFWPNGDAPDAPAFPHAKNAIAEDIEPEEKTVATKKKKATKKKVVKKAPAKKPEPRDEEEEIGLVHGPFIKGGFPTETIKLKGKDELLIVHCDACKCTHYYLAQPQEDNPKKFDISELAYGENIAWVERTPSGDMDSEGAMEHVEDEVEEH